MGERPAVVAGQDVMTSVLKTLQFAPIDAATWLPIRKAMLRVVNRAHDLTLAVKERGKSLPEMTESLQALEEALDILMTLTPRG